MFISYVSSTLPPMKSSKDCFIVSGVCVLSAIFSLSSSIASWQLTASLTDQMMSSRSLSQIDQAYVGSGFVITSLLVANGALETISSLALATKYAGLGLLKAVI
jgi:hypothetical protein